MRTVAYFVLLLLLGPKETVMNKKLLLALGFAGMASISVANAAEEAATPAVAATQSSEWNDDRFYVFGFGTFVQPGGDRNAASGWGTGAAFGKIINEYFNVELEGFWQGMNQNGAPNLGGATSSFGTGGRSDTTGGTANLLYFFQRDTFSPYVLFGLGGMNTSSTISGPNGSVSRSNSGFIFEAGAGATYELADNFLLRADVRYRGDTTPGGISATNPATGVTYNSNTSVFNDLVVNAGFVIPFGDKPDQVAAKPVAAADACASKDSDADGVNDCDDKCAGTAAGTKVDDQGCPIVMELKGVNFHYDSAELTEGAKHVLNGVVDQLVAFPAKKDIEVAGYASFEGNKAAEKHNLQLSQRRSESVAHYLKHKGVANKLFAKGYGTEYPVADNKTEVGREKNRRVELRWMGD